MCVIIVKQQKQQTPTDVIKTSARINPDGLGIVWLDTYEITYHKSSEYMVLDTTRPFIAHFRYATIGKVGRSNTHPFQCGPNSNEYLMMNGHIHGLGNTQH
jgi:predicted glutamine amidotransferase